MENNIPLASKKIWNIVRMVLFMLRRGTSKKKLMVDLNMMLKRGKIAGKAIGNLMFHHHHHHHHHSSGVRSATSSSAIRPIGQLEYEFSCSNSPANAHHLNSLHHLFSSFHLGKPRKAGGSLNNFFGCAHPPPTLDDDPNPLQLERAVIEFLNSHQPDMTPAVEASPMLPGFGRTPLVRQLRITDSPFPLKNEDDGDDGIVDKAAEEFIERFYKELRRQ
ncbi:uncharacterized protein LOC116198825 [Punica granatum]|uniref:Avr9/Cf-9 rapidly elicited protein 146 n=2 Tax=Punica granatum TaxID=22663 RepID=A0A218X055_PUNGR|nr:uncharacterized protein LOC116198825 [Punica granatum]OWM78109.1 hypothetical protein CDL15_Pgr014928 [Punica granatum]PKI79301.1 hypothetical protein CRG98_000315 [Punica granatum]